ncbi:hypothetical protein V5O48_010099 [Marasmius crinis-equi]|uniref:Uncharacterized protein n=1 Tax=Marasmius crinis-equi TaxID=585013 RepID=A0ABR3F993_9AGAR
MTLSGQSDWDGCVKDVRAHQSKKKEYAAVEIATTEQYMKSLITALKKLKKTNSSGFATGQAGRKGGKKDKSSGPLLDLLAGSNENVDNEGTIDDEGGSTSLMELEKQAGECLWARYENCQLCGPSVMCKIGLDASSLAAPGKSSILQPSSNSTIPDPVTNTLMAATAALIAKSLRKSPTKRPGGHSSNRADLKYPLISLFMAKLHAAHPKQNLDLYADAFHREDLYNIDEIVDRSIPELTADRFGLSFGNAKFLLTKAKSQVRRIRATGL